MRAAFIPLAAPRGPIGPSGCAAARPPRGRTGHGRARLQGEHQQVAAGGAAGGRQEGNMRPGVRPGAGRVQPVVQPRGAEQELRRTGVRPTGAGAGAKTGARGAAHLEARVAARSEGHRPAREFTHGRGRRDAGQPQEHPREAWVVLRQDGTCRGLAPGPGLVRLAPVPDRLRGARPAMGAAPCRAAGRGARGRRTHRLQQGRAVVQDVGRPGVVHSVGAAGHQRRPRRGQARGEAIQVQGRIPAGARELDQGGGQCRRAGQPGLHQAAERSVCARGLTFLRLRGRP